MRHPVISSGGFTLLEVLISLAITSLLISVLMGALYYIFRVQDTLREEVITREASLRSRAWFDVILAGCLPAGHTSQAAFTGTATELTCETNNPVIPSRLPISATITLSLTRDESNTFGLNYLESGSKTLTGKGITLTNLIGSNVFFRYVDATGKEYDLWPPRQPEPDVLPRLIKLVAEGSSGEEIVWLAAPLADSWLPPTIKNPFGVELPR